MICDTCNKRMNYSFHVPDRYWRKANDSKKEGYLCAHCFMDAVGGHWEVNRILQWRDSNIINGQTDEIPEVAFIETAGHFVEETGDRITIARDKIDGDYRGIISIPKENIIE